jgi:hypothetical protein
MGTMTRRRLLQSVAALVCLRHVPKPKPLTVQLDAAGNARYLTADGIVVGGINRVTYTWHRNRVGTNDHKA